MQVKQIIAELQEVFLDATQQLAHSSGFCQRTSPITAQAWVQGLVFGWLAQPQASVKALACALAEAGADVTPQAVQQRFNEPGARLLLQVLERLTAHVLQHGMSAAELARELRSWAPGNSRLWRRMHWLKAFPRIWIRDSTIIMLPLALREKWRGAGGASGPNAGLKISVQWEWHSGIWLPFRLASAARHDQSVAQAQDQELQDQGHQIVPGEMHLFDLGYFKLEWLRSLASQGAYFCCRYRYATAVQRASGDTQNGPAWLVATSMTTHLVDWLAQMPLGQTRLELDVLLGKRLQVPCRLLALRVPEDLKRERQAQLKAKCQDKGQVCSAERLELCGWTVLVTNAPCQLLSFEQAFVLYRLRWQVERLFRLWKETLHLDEWRTQQPGRIECEIYAKLIGAMLTQQLTAYAAWDDPARSLKQCAQIIAQHAKALLVGLECPHILTRILQGIRAACRKGARIETRRKKPATFQRLLFIQNP